MGREIHVNRRARICRRLRYADVARQRHLVEPFAVDRFELAMVAPLIVARLYRSQTGVETSVLPTRTRHSFGPDSR